MQYDAKTPQEYLQQLEPDWRREKLLALRQLIKAKAPQLTEGIEYKMLRYGNEDSAVFHLNAQQNYVSLYVGDASKIDPTGELLAGLNIGKGCIRFSKTKQIEQTQIDQFIERAVTMWTNQEDIDC